MAPLALKKNKMQRFSNLILQKCAVGSNEKRFLQNVISSNENPVIAQQPESSVIESDLEEPVKVVAMTPPPMEEGVVGGLPNQNEDNWMKEAYQQVARCQPIKPIA